MSADVLSRRRYLALLVVCFGVLLIVLDTTIVNVALPSIGQDLGFSETSLVWIVNAYLLTFGSSLLLGGRLGDILGSRRVFLIGIAVFTAASLLCGIAGSRLMLIAARALQGIGGAIVLAVALSLIVRLFEDGPERARAVGIYSVVSAGGGSAGLLLGGVLTSAFTWHWIFLVNVPIGAIVYLLCSALLPADPVSGSTRRLDGWGAATAAGSLLLAVYAIVSAQGLGWAAANTLASFAGAGTCFVLFVTIESRVASPLVPLRIFRTRSLAIACVVGTLWAAGTFTWFLSAAVHLQSVWGYGPMQIAFAFLPANVLTAVCSMGLSAKITERCGLRVPLVAGLAMVSLGLLLFSRVPLDGTYVRDIAPGMILIGLGGAVAFTPLLMAGMRDIPGDASGLASGILNTSFMVGGALGLATLVGIAASRTSTLLIGGASDEAAIVGGYRVALLLASVSVLVAAVVGATLSRTNFAKLVTDSPCASERIRN